MGVKQLIIYGAGWPDVIKLVGAINRIAEEWQIVGIIDDTPAKQGSSFMGYPVIGGAEKLRDLDHEDVWTFNNVYSTTASRRAVAQRLTAAGCRLTRLVHPSVDASWVQLGVDTIVSDGAVLGANVTIGDHCAVRSNTLVAHDSIIEDCVFIGPGVTLCGHVTVRSGAYIGAGCTIRQHLEIGRDSLIGAGSMVTRDVRPGDTVTGVPAKPMAKRGEAG